MFNRYNREVYIDRRMKLSGSDASKHLNRVNKSLACLEPFVFTRYSDGKTIYVVRQRNWVNT